MYNLKPEESISGIIKCNNCGTEIKWCYRIPPKEYGMYAASYPTDIVFASKVRKDVNDNTYCIRCKNCDKLIDFQYNE